MVRPLIYDLNTQRKRVNDTLLKNSEKRTAFSNLLNAEQLEIFNQIAGKPVKYKRRDSTPVPSYQP